ncbi:hypothetical protein SGFS_055630 [Streptomyces graminofaciens]|uniref:Uncharacterized protein n=1 Tax=Streptomyces graminofaciens TaxID=68212 RepID=A0ABM7FDV2_9ACTN|nr:hypothetical protein SGFS_055630 [Streptomyces graminofaciens]
MRPTSQSSERGLGARDLSFGALIRSRWGSVSVIADARANLRRYYAFTDQVGRLGDMLFEQ